jgi:hypothetical protein
MALCELQPIIKVRMLRPQEDGTERRTIRTLNLENDRVCLAMRFLVLGVEHNGISDRRLSRNSENSNTTHTFDLISYNRKSDPATMNWLL